MQRAATLHSPLKKENVLELVGSPIAEIPEPELPR